LDPSWPLTFELIVIIENQPCTSVGRVLIVLPQSKKKRSLPKFRSRFPSNEWPPTCDKIGLNSWRGFTPGVGGLREIAAQTPGNCYQTWRDKPAANTILSNGIFHRTPDRALIRAAAPPPRRPSPCGPSAPALLEDRRSSFWATRFGGKVPVLAASPPAAPAHPPCGKVLCSSPTNQLEPPLDLPQRASSCKKKKRTAKAQDRRLDRTVPFEHLGDFPGHTPSSKLRLFWS